MKPESNIKVPITRVAYAVSVALTGGYAPGAIAQTQQMTDLDAVIVTARKRAESLIDVPQEVQAISQTQLERANITSTNDVSRFVPSLSYNATAPGRATIYFRGVADDSSSFIADSSAAIYLDEQPLTQSSLQPEIRLVDIERIEALPGPQGTLYGSSSQSGTLRYITNKPDTSGFETIVDVDASTVKNGEQGYDVSGVLNLPLSDNVALRVVGFTAHEAGFIDNVLGESLGGTFDNASVVDKDVNGVDYTGGRAALRWRPNEKWTVDTGVVYQKMKAHTNPEDNVDRTGHELQVVRFVDEKRDDEWVQGSLTLQGDLGWAQFTSATNYFTRDTSYFQDNTDYTFYLSRNFGAYYANYDLGPDPKGLGWHDTDFARRFAQEFRLQGESEHWTWLAGLFYEHVHEGYNFVTRIADYENTPSFAYWNAYYGVEPGSTDNSFYHSNNDQVTRQYATFGEVNYSPTDHWTLTAGLRWFDHNRKRDYFIQQPNGRFSANLGSAQNTTSDFTKKLSIQYKFNANAMAYALFSDGFRAGGRNVVRPGTVLPPDYDADFLDNYEVGLKTRWAGGKYTFNLTAFQMEWKDYQVEVVDPGPLYAVLVANVGNAEIKGVSAEFSAYLWDSLDIGLNFQMLDPKTKSDNAIIGTEAGTRLPFSPKEKGALWIEYTVPKEVAGGHFYGRYQWTYNGDVPNGIFDVRLQPAYQLVDVKLGFQAEDWEVYTYVDNLMDERAIFFDQGGAPPGLKTISAPRTWGVGFSKSWGPR